MKYIYIFVFTFLYSCKTQDKNISAFKIEESFDDSGHISIDSLYSKIYSACKLNFKELPCQFYFDKNNEQSGEFFAKVKRQSCKMELAYYGFPDGRNDLLIMNSDSIKLSSKLDPQTMRVYTMVSVHNKNYYIFTGKGQSASGSGNQILFYVIVGLNNEEKRDVYYETSSRFGRINNLIDCKKDGHFEIIRISNDKKLGHFKLTISNLETNQREVSDSMQLRYISNDRFMILKSTIPFEF